MRIRGILRRTLEYAERHGMLPRSGRVLTGLSGGPDSVALLGILHTLNESGRIDVALSAVHLNHSIRGRDADADALFCREFAANLGVPLVVKRVDVPCVARRRGVSLEEAARYVRYEVFRTEALVLARKSPRAPVVIALGHQADDQAETVLHRILRGTGVAGLAGIPSVRRMDLGSGGKTATIVRPLLTTRRSEILAYLHERGVPYRTDTSNLGTEFMRNRLRNELLPLLREKYNPSVDEALLRLADIARQWSEAVEAATGIQKIAAQTGASQVWKREGKLDVPAAALANRPEAWAQMLLKRIFENAGVPLKRFSRKHYSALMEMARGCGGRQLHLPGMVAVRDGESIRLQREKEVKGRETPSRKSVMLAVGGSVKLPGGKVEVSCLESTRRFKPAEHNGWSEVVDADRVSPPLKVRFPRPGDRFRPLGAPGRKKVLEFLAGRGVPAAERLHVPIVADRRGIIWVVGHRIDDRVKVTRGTKRLFLLKCSGYAT